MGFIEIATGLSKSHNAHIRDTKHVEITSYDSDYFKYDYKIYEFGDLKEASRFFSREARKNERTAAIYAFTGMILVLDGFINISDNYVSFGTTEVVSGLTLLRVGLSYLNTWRKAQTAQEELDNNNIVG